MATMAMRTVEEDLLQPMPIRVWTHTTSPPPLQNEATLKLKENEVRE
jgi:hypothetical protein